MTTRGAILGAMLLASAAVAAGCASAPIDASRAVRIHISNPTPMTVWVEFARSAGGARWVRSVGPRRDREFLVRHRAFGDGRVRVRLVRWPGALHLTKVYRGERRFRVPPGSRIEVRLAPDLRKTTVWLAPGRPGPVSLRPR